MSEQIGKVIPGSDECYKDKNSEVKQGTLEGVIISWDGKVCPLGENDTEAEI